MRDVHFMYAASVMKRYDSTADWNFNWRNDIDMNTWKIPFNYHLDRKYGIKLGDDGTVLKGNTVIATYKLEDSSFVSSELDWIKATKQATKCPYTAKHLGFIFWTVEDPLYVSYLMYAFAEASRGVVTCVLDSSKFVPCVAERSYSVTTLFDPDQYGTNILLLEDYEKTTYIGNITFRVRRTMYEAAQAKGFYSREMTFTQTGKMSVKPMYTDWSESQLKFGKACKPIITGTEHIKFAQQYQSVMVKLWCFPPTLKQDLQAILLYDQ